ncbi:toxin-antitoxin system YwqK family antitoxin [Flagellimonas nanhaiensis]|uniref:Toxin-antitoxin system YwqK family antitoxin n=1 Tax=Flagellimonas nanhaiensis TaxID=2292706 RepID=A0A371JPH6_9FLAO|nr:hypothetical protein [Allomuricauda nanhaiensis]RDY59419.1 hypothetical protein DX873_08510 [Allomuricauda nanhaiensis]
MIRLAIALSLLFFVGKSKMYHREYYDNGLVKAEGWKQGDTKEDFWKHYFSNGKIQAQGHYKMDLKDGYWYFHNKEGKLEKEGHFKKGQQINWWLFYDANGKINHKCQLRNGVKNGYCLKYTDEELKSAEKYKNGKKIKEWFSFDNFKRENKLSDLK